MSAGNIDERGHADMSTWASAAKHADADGWVRWAQAPPHPMVEVEARRHRNGPVFFVTPAKQPDEWNVAGLEWRVRFSQMG